MRKRAFFIVLIAISLFLTSCGQTNYFGWATSNEVSSLDSAQQALDQGKYNKAASILEDVLADNPDDKNTNILYAQALMGKAGVDMANFFDDLTTDNPAGNSPLLNLQATVPSADRDLIYKAADIFSDYLPDDGEDKMVGSICTLTAAATILAQKFDPEGIGIENVTTGDIQTNYSLPSENIVTVWQSMEWSGDLGVTNKHMEWINRSITLITAFASGDVNESIEESQYLLQLMDLASGSGQLYWFVVRENLFGIQD